MLVPTGRRRIERRLDSFVQNTAAIYRAVRDVSGADVVVDSSKLPPYGFLQAQSPGIDLRCVHLIRDPRATAYSWLRRSRAEGIIGEDYLPPIGTTESSMTWTAWNIVTELLWRSDSSHYTRIRYEDFVCDPQRWSGAMTALCGFANAALPIDHDKKLSVGVAHTVAGNPNRFDTGSIAIRADQAWEGLIGSRQRYAVTAMTLPFLRHYGYPIGRSSRR